MKRRYRFTHGFCLVAYLWTATGLSQATFVNTLINTHARASVLLETAPDDEWFLHHVGHRDAHEPNAIDHERHAADQAAEHSRTLLEKSRFEGQELKIRSQTLDEQVKEMGFEALDNIDAAFAGKDMPFKLA